MTNITPEAKARQIKHLKEPWKPREDRAYDSQINLKVHKETKELLKSVPNWNQKLRNAIAQLIEAEAVEKDAA